MAEPPNPQIERLIEAVRDVRSTMITLFVVSILVSIIGAAVVANRAAEAVQAKPASQTPDPARDKDWSSIKP